MIERYALPEMARIWTLENKFKKWMAVELHTCDAWAKLGVIPQEAAALIRQRASFNVERIDELEKKIRHDVVAFTRCVSENLGEESRYFHYGLTSSDVVDTALSVMLVETTVIIQKSLQRLAVVLSELARKHKETLMAGRTHGVHAEPVTLGLKFALWFADTRRNLQRLERARDVIRYGKISGAVGTYANIDPFVEEYVCEKLGLKAAPVSTQILQRDRHAEFLCTLAITASCLDKIATEIRGLQKTEVRELEEPFYADQKGSSAMPHKRNPVSSERICGLARVVRGNAQVALENIALWHERDISHSSAERVILPDSTALVHFMIEQLVRILRDLHVYPQNMQRNLDSTGGLIYSQRVLLALVDKGLSRENAYDLVQRCAMYVWENEASLLEVLEENELVRNTLSREELYKCFEPDYYLRHIGRIYERLGI